LARFARKIEVGLNLKKAVDIVTPVNWLNKAWASGVLAVYPKEIIIVQVLAERHAFCA
jgi:hypothetical protein